LLEQHFIFDPDFFNIQRSDLCDWHFQDPVDEQEWNATHTIGFYQDGKVNPFVLDCSLAVRTYCDQIGDACALVNVNNLVAENYISISPNPISDYFDLQIASSVDLEQLTLINGEGKIVKSLDTNLNRFSLSDLSEGFYFLKAKTQLGLFTLKVAKL